MDPQRSQIYHWIRTGRHVIRTDYKKPSSVRSGIVASDAAESSNDNDASATSTTSSSLPNELLGADDDVLIPKTVDINRIFHQGRETWAQLLESAKSLPLNSFPVWVRDPSITLKDIPALPKSLPKNGVLVGQPLWHVPDPEHQEKDAQNNGWNLQYVRGLQKYFRLCFSQPIECRLAVESDFSHFGHVPHPDGRPFAAPDGLSLLTLCWSYIISVRFLELQRVKVQYSRQFLQPRIVKASHAQQGDVVLNLGASVSRALVRWLCAILAPKPGWFADGGGFPPWAAYCSGDIHFTVSTNEAITFSPNEELPPTSAQATEFLIELCGLYGLGPEKGMHRSSEILLPATAAFLAALALPFYRHVNLQPQFTVPTLGNRTIDRAVLEPIHQYVVDLPYYMTLSMHPRSLGSVLWSIFWQPDIECNVVSPWLSSILSVLRPIIDSRNLVILAKVFAIRRPRVGIWWLGVFLLGDHTVLDWIARYLETLEERWGFGSMAPPDTAVAAWTGSPQSFLDQKPSYTSRNLLDPVSRADLLRHRHNRRLQDETSLPLSWRPFGYVAKETIELDLWPWLEYGDFREYVHWVWWIKEGKSAVCDIQLGFRKDTGRFVIDVPDSLELNHPDQLTGCNNVIKLTPSRESTLRMITYCIEDICGDRDTNISTVCGAKVHPWLKYWRGLE
ncbi:hypothetical protein GQX73_g10683 [Xylaria multiplex]|uniref:Uncharacterized protein n=1 Tax=Xylaria multiplex TaxID=323545 RepID=A0A7C8MJF6_9PEZI|nr:hypothetical protein GQX73_g10683 [Xylaria multiplex]